MLKIKIMNEYLHGPIWVENSDDIPVWKCSLVEEDATLSQLNEKAMQMFSSYYEFDSHDLPCWFNHEKEIAEKNIMLDLISQIKNRLEEINDGSFIVEDLETERLNSL